MGVPRVSSGLAFPPFRLEPDNAQLWRGEVPVALRHKSFALLCYLAERPGRLVTKDELLAALWPGTFVSDVVLKVCVNELRQALGDDAKEPRFIATVHRRGYRFVAAVTPVAPPAEEDASAVAPPRLLVGRAAELGALEAAFAAACGGRRQTVLVAGEAGIGKTTLLDAFAARLASGGGPAGGAGPWLARGGCVALYGEREPFLPLLDGLGRLCRAADGAPFAERLRALAPDWSAQVGGELGATERATPVRPRGPAPERMLRVLARALEAIAAERPVVLVLEDLHWSDQATVDLLSYLAQRPDPARLLIVGSYRPVDAIVRGHPLRAVKQDLVQRGLGREITLGFLDEAAVATYLEQRFPGAAWTPGFAPWLARRTDGSPLFLAAVIDDLVARGVVAPEGVAVPAERYEAIGVPETLKQMIEQQLERLEPHEERLVEAASVAGARFSAAAVAAALEADVLDVEERCAAWARRGELLREAGEEEWPDGTVAARFAFRHSLYREHVYGRISAARRAQLHRRIGDRLEQAYGARATEIAAELALHLVEGRAYRRAIPHLRSGADRALRAGACREALAALDRALSLLDHVPDERERASVAMDLSLVRGQALLVARGFAHPEVKEAFGRVRELSERMEETPQLVIGLAGLWTYHHARGETRETRDAAERVARLAERLPMPAFALLSSVLEGLTRQQAGDFRAARDAFERALATRVERGPFGYVDLATPCRSELALVLLVLGEVDRARALHREVLADVRATGDFLARAMTLASACELLYALGDPPALRAVAEEGAALASEHGLPLWLAFMRASRGAALAALGELDLALADLEPCTAELVVHGGGNLRPLLLAVLGETHARAGDARAGLRLVDEALALVDPQLGHRHLAEIHRLRGRCLEAAGDRAAAEAEYRSAIAIARGQSARWWELRAAADLATLLLERGRREEARRALAPVCDAFAGTSEVAELARARGVLARCAPRRQPAG